MPDVTFVEGIPTSFSECVKDRKFFIINDLVQEIDGNRDVVNLFTRGSHHYNLSVIFITQNICHKGKEMREMSLNAHYLFWFKARRDISHLGSQLYPNKLKFFQEVYLDATKKPFLI